MNEESFPEEGEMIEDGSEEEEGVAIDLSQLNEEQLQRLMEEHPEMAQEIMENIGFEDEDEEEEDDGEEMEYQEGEEYRGDEAHDEAINEEFSEQMKELASGPEFEKMPQLDPHRKVRRDVLNQINKLRIEEKCNDLDLDYFVSQAANQYAEYCGSTERDGNPEVLKEILQNFGIPGEYTAVIGYRYLEEEEQANAKNLTSKLFLDAHGLTYEINETREIILSPEFTHVGFGVALMSEIYVITELFSKKALRLETIKHTEDEKGIEFIGQILAEDIGPYAMRITASNDSSKVASLIGPDKMKFDLESGYFVINIDNPNIMYINPPLIGEIYIRKKPSTIPYQVETAESVEKDLKFLTLAFKASIQHFPDFRIVMEENQYNSQEQKQELERQREEEEARQIKERENEEKRKLWEQRMDQFKEQDRYRDADSVSSPLGSLGASLEGSLSQGSLRSISPSEDQREGSAAKSSREHSVSKSSVAIEKEKNEEEDDDNKEEYNNELEMDEEKRRFLDAQDRQEREKLEWSIQVAKEDYEKLINENKNLQNEVKEYLKKKNINITSGDASMNSLKYINNLVSVTQTRVQMKQTQETFNKMAQDLQEKLQYHQARSDDMKKSFKEFKRVVAESAEFNRTGKKINIKELDKWEREDDEQDQLLQKERFTYITQKRKLKQAEEELKKKDKVAEGLSVIDFEQLKIENQTLNEKIEERNEEIHKLNTKIREGVIMLTHMREKSYQLSEKIEKEKTAKQEIDKKMAEVEARKNEAKNKKMEQENKLKKTVKSVGFLEATKSNKKKMASKWEKIGAPKLIKEDPNLVEEHKNTCKEIIELKEKLIPKYTKKRQEYEEKIRFAKSKIPQNLN